MKKQAIVFLLIAAMAIAVLPGMAFAHGHNRASRVSSTVSYPLCSFENCSIAKTHMHGGICYAGHSAGDGHAHHQVCSMRNCTIATAHEHNGVICAPRGTGHGGKGRHH